MGRPVLWLEEAYENIVADAEPDSFFLVYDIMFYIQEWIDALVSFQEEYPDGMPLPVVELTDDEAERRYKGGVARGRVV